MSTTSVTPTAAADRAAAQKAAQTKPNSQPNSTPGQFATLMLLQADEETTASTPDTTAQAPGDEAEPEQAKANEHQPTDTSQLALQALLDWRGLLNSNSNGMRQGTPSPLSASGDDGASTPKKFNPSTSIGVSGWSAPSSEDADIKAALEKASEAPTADGNRPQPGTTANPAGGSDSVSTAKPKSGTGRTNPLSAQHASTAPAPDTKVPPQTNEFLNGKGADFVSHARSTLDLAMRGNETENTAPNAAAPADTLEVTAVTRPSGPDTTAGEGLQQADMGTPTVATTDNTPTPESFSDVFQQQMAEVDAQVNYWTAQGAQRASFTIGNPEDGMLDVKLSFADGELAVAFETDEESVREVLQNGAQEALQRLMDAQGIALGNVSVGGGRNNTPQDAPSERPTVDLAQRGRGLKTATPNTPVATTPRVPNIMTATKLDFYA
jgi:hypothetical protein